MIILVLNCGSSSLKYQLLDMKSDEVYDLIAKGLVERIGMKQVASSIRRPERNLSLRKCLSRTIL